jgi:hypothetical protein
LPVFDERLIVAVVVPGVTVTDDRTGCGEEVQVSEVVWLFAPFVSVIEEAHEPVVQEPSERHA